MQSFAEFAIKVLGNIWSVILHTIFIGGIFAARFLGFEWNTILLLLTTILSIEAIYLELFNLIANKKLIDEKK